MSLESGAAARCLLFGGTGRLGRALQRAAPPHCRIHAPPRREVDLRTAEVEHYLRIIGGIRPAAIINAAAVASVDRAETERAEALAVNTTAPGRIAQAAASAGVPLIHVSTDYVFGGNPQDAPFEVDAPTAPLQWYGETKAKGEREVLEAGAAATVVRVSWLFGDGESPFEAFVIGQLAQGIEVGVEGEQRSRPTSIPSLARWLLAVGELMGDGLAVPPILHPTGGPSATRAEWARKILDARGFRGAEVVNRPRAGASKAAPRPSDSSLAGGKTLSWTNEVELQPLIDWQVGVRYRATTSGGASRRAPELSG